MRCMFENCCFPKLYYFQIISPENLSLNLNTFSLPEKNLYEGENVKKSPCKFIDKFSKI